MANESTDPRGNAEARQVRQTFGLTIRELRKARGWSQEDLAQYMTDAGYSMHQTTVAKLENGARPTAVDELVALSRVLDLPPASLVPPEDEARGTIREALSRLQVVNAELRATDEELARLQHRRDRLEYDRDAAQAAYFRALEKFRVPVPPLSDAGAHVRMLAEMQREFEANASPEELKRAEEAYARYEED